MRLMRRITIRLDDQIDAGLTREARRTGESRASLLRQAAWVGDVHRRGRRGEHSSAGGARRRHLPLWTQFTDTRFGTRDMCGRITGTQSGRHPTCARRADRRADPLPVAGFATPGRCGDPTQASTGWAPKITGCGGLRMIRTSSIMRNPPQTAIMA
ncbi:MAG: ribbon-helix-helix protein, CopG family [Kineosporiaceae bacterium]